jgi:cadmium resistance protein CadD (predicted permease)
MNIESIVTSIVAFISTNIDDLFLLMLFYAGNRFSRSTIMTGQYLGIGVLIAISFTGAYIGSFFDQRYVGLLGGFPIYLAIRDAIGLLRGKDDDDTNAYLKRSGFAAIAGVTIANGGDNIGVYVPLLTAMSTPEKIQLVMIFALATYAWCRAAQYLAFHPLVAKQLAKYGHVVTPVVLFLLGVFILIESGTFSLISR